MTHLRPVPFRKALRAFAALGFIPVRTKGSHVILMHSDGRLVVLPRHAAKDVGVGLLRAQLKIVGVDVDEFVRLL